MPKPHPSLKVRLRIGRFHLTWLTGTVGDRLNRKRPPRKGGEPERMTVEPDYPKGLSGGAAVALEFDE